MTNASGEVTEGRDDEVVQFKKDGKNMLGTKNKRTGDVSNICDGLDFARRVMELFLSLRCTKQFLALAV